MALTVTRETAGPNTIGNRRSVIATVNFDSSYATNGETVAPADFGLNRIDFMVLQPTAGYVFEYVASTGKIKAYRSGTADAVLNEVSNAVNLSAITATAFVVGV